MAATALRHRPHAVTGPGLFTRLPQAEAIEIRGSEGPLAAGGKFNVPGVGIVEIHRWIPEGRLLDIELRYRGNTYTIFDLLMGDHPNCSGRFVNLHGKKDEKKDGQGIYIPATMHQSAKVLELALMAAKHIAQTGQLQGLKAALLRMYARPMVVTKKNELATVTYYRDTGIMELEWTEPEKPGWGKLAVKAQVSFPFVVNPVVVTATTTSADPFAGEKKGDEVQIEDADRESLKVRAWAMAREFARILSELPENLSAQWECSNEAYLRTHTFNGAVVV